MPTPRRRLSKDSRMLRGASSPKGETLPSGQDSPQRARLSPAGRDVAVGDRVGGGRGVCPKDRRRGGRKRCRRKATERGEGTSVGRKRRPLQGLGEVAYNVVGRGAHTPPPSTTPPLVLTAGHMGPALQSLKRPAVERRAYPPPLQHIKKRSQEQNYPSFTIHYSSFIN